MSVKVMQVLTRIEGASANLRGALFELVTGSLVKDVEGGYLKTGQKIIDRGTGRKAEVDVQLDKENNAGFLIIECKAKSPGARVSKNDVRKWYSDRVPMGVSETLCMGFGPCGLNGSFVEPLGV